MIFTFKCGILFTEDSEAKWREKLSGIIGIRVFLGAMELEFIDYKDELVFDGEHQLSKEPLKMDLLIIKKKKDSVIANQIGEIFRQYNTFEFKSPRDSLTIDDYIKTVGYAYLYKGLGKSVNEIPHSELTVTLVRESCRKVYSKVLLQKAVPSGKITRAFITSAASSVSRRNLY